MKFLENTQKIIEKSKKRVYNEAIRKRFKMRVKFEATSMKKDKFRRLKRIELYEIMLAQSQEIDQLKKELAETKKQLVSQEIKLEKAGSIAEASLSLTKVFEEAQKAADLYLKNVQTLKGDGVNEE